MALMGLDGQRYSHLPQPIQRSSMTLGMSGDWRLPYSLRTIEMAPAGQPEAHLPQLASPLADTQRS